MVKISIDYHITFTNSLPGSRNVEVQ